MRIDVDHQDFLCIVDALKGQLTKAQAKRAENLVRRLTTPYTDPRRTWAPMRIRSAWPSDFAKSSRKRDPFHHKPRDKKPPKPKPAPKVPPTADEILAAI